MVEFFPDRGERRCDIREVTDPALLFTKGGLQADLDAIGMAMQAGTAVSRWDIREAMRTLKMEGLVDEADLGHSRKRA